MALGRKTRMSIEKKESSVRRDPPLYERMNENNQFENPFEILDELKGMENSDYYGNRSSSKHSLDDDELFGKNGVYSNSEQKYIEEPYIEEGEAYNPIAERRERSLSKGKGPKKKRKKKKQKRRTIVTIIIAVLVILVLMVGFILAYGWGLLSKVTPIDLGDDLGIDSTVATELSEYKNILIAGVDARAGEDYDSTRTDAIIILSLDQTTEEIKMISVYRDTYLEIESESGTTYYSKINAANTEGGIANTVKALNTNMDLNIDEVIVLNWQTVADVVDSIGGVDVEIQDYEIDEMNTYIVDTADNIDGDYTLITEAGMQTLNGTQAVTYARIRKVGNADFERTERMRTLISATISKALTTDFTTLNSVATSAAEEVVTSLKPREIVVLAKSMLTYEQGASEGWPYLEQPDGSYMTTTGMIDGQSVVIPVNLEDNVIKLHEDFFAQPGYETTDTVTNISNEISWITGYY